MNADEFRERMKAITPPQEGSYPPLWNYWQRDIWEIAVAGNDPEGLFGWPCIRHCMRVDHWRGATEIEFQRLTTELRKACLMPDFGHPKDTYIGHIDPTEYSAALIHQAHHLLQWQKHTGMFVSDLDYSVFEFGGGYGAMALVLRRLGYKGRYIIFDLPEFALLQEYYLSNLGVDGVTWITSPSEFYKMGANDLFIACFSLSEVDLKLRFQTLKHVTADSYLFLYNTYWVDYDNVKYFEEVVPEYFNQMKWVTVPADHLPDDNRYTFGYKPELVDAL